MIKYRFVYAFSVGPGKNYTFSTSSRYFYGPGREKKGK